MPDRGRIAVDDPTLRPLETFFNSIPDSDVLFVFMTLSKGIGYSYNDVHCSFPKDIDPGDEPFEGVKFTLFEDAITVDVPTFLRYLRGASLAFLREHPKDREAIEAILNQAASLR